ncbi:MAG: DUF4240 domain-containing protein [Hellea sp.]
MSDKNFWSIIDKTKADDQDTQSQQLKVHLSQLSKDDLIAFEAVYRAKLSKAFHWDLWAAAYIINGGCSDDGFDYFCDWLISRGQKVYVDALENPETLVGEATPWETEFEEYRYIMMEVMEDVHHGEFPLPSVTRPPEPLGDSWDEESVEEKFPLLASWVNSSVETVVQPLPTETQKKPRTFWQRLFGKK